MSAAHIKLETAKDVTMSSMLRYITHGWPDYQFLIESIKPYHQFRSRLAVVQGCIVRGERVLIPEVLRKGYLEQLHEGHQGMSKTKELARLHVWWPNMNRQIEFLVQSCNGCQVNANQPLSTQIQPLPWPREPWRRLNIDLAGPFLGINFLVVIDAHSKWPEVKIMKSTTSREVIKKLQAIFACFGTPHTIISDNGPQFASAEFDLFMYNLGIEHRFTAPYHPQSNGAA